MRVFNGIPWRPWFFSLHRSVFFLFCLLLPTQLGYHFWPDWSLIYGRRIDYLSPTIYVTDVLLFFMIILRIFAYPKILKDGFCSVRRHKLTITILLVCAVVNIVYSVNASATSIKWLKVLEISFLFLYVSRTPMLDALFKRAVVLSLLFSVFLGCMQFINQGSIGGALWFLGERNITPDTPGAAILSTGNIPYVSLRIENQRFLRAYSVFSHPNAFAGYCLLSVSFFLSPLYASSASKGSVWRVLGCVVGAIGIIISTSRSALIVFTLLIAFFFRKKNSQVISYSVLFLMAFCFLLVALTFHDLNLYPRIVFITYWARGFITNIFVGNGLGNSVYMSKSLALPWEKFQPVHNVYLLLLGELGVLGLSAGIFVVKKLTKVQALLQPNVRGITFALFSLAMLDHFIISSQQVLLLSVVLVGLMTRHTSAFLKTYTA